MGAVGANVTPAAVQKDYPFDPLRDYVPVAMVAEWSAILVVKKDLPVNTLAEFVAYAKARPGALNFGTTGYGSFAHLVSEVFMQQTGIAMQHVQYKGGVAGDQRSARRHDRRAHDELGGRRRSGRESAAEDARGREHAAAAVDPEGADHGGGGRARASTRPPGSACSGRPACRTAIRERIAREVVAIANDPAYQAKFRNTGFEPLGLDAQATARMYRDEVDALDRVHQGARTGREVSPEARTAVATMRPRGLAEKQVPRNPDRRRRVAIAVCHTGSVMAARIDTHCCLLWRAPSSSIRG